MSLTGVTSPDQLAPYLRGLDNDEFCEIWTRLTDEGRSAAGAEFFQRYRRLSPYRLKFDQKMKPVNDSRSTKLPPGTTIDGAALLSDVQLFIKRFCAFPDAHCLTAVTLWAAHAHLIDRFHTTPRLALLSPEAASGKTRVLEVLDLLVPEPLLTLNASPAAVFRTLAQRQITLLFDETDAIWSKRRQDDNHEDLRALLNAGYKRGATIPRCVGPKHDVVNFNVYAAVALAGLGNLPDTIMSRSVIIRMRRRAPNELIESFRTRLHESGGHELRDRLAQWAKYVAVGEQWPELPPGITDRPAEVWEPLIAVADAAGGDWLGLAREACVALCTVADDRRVSLGVRFLRDLRIVFGDAIALHTATLLQRLIDGTDLEPDAPWGDLHGKPLGERGLAKLLKQYGVRSTKVNVDGRHLQGYRREDLWDAWVRYLPPSLPGEAEPAEPVEPSDAPQVPGVPQVPDRRSPKRDADHEPDEALASLAANISAVRAPEVTL